MNRQPLAQIEDVISILEEKHAELVVVLRGTEVPEEDLNLHNLYSAHQVINSRRLRMAIDAVTSALKEARSLSKER